MLVGQRLHQGFVHDERGHRYPVPFYLDEVQGITKLANDDGKVHAYANLRGSPTRPPMQVEIETGTLHQITYGRSELSR